MRDVTPNATNQEAVKLSLKPAPCGLFRFRRPSRNHTRHLYLERGRGRRPICGRTALRPILRIPPGSGSFTPNFYISTTGSDGNDGLTPATAWAITALNTKRTTYTGKSVGLLNGTYSVYSILSGFTDQDQWALDVDGGTVGSPTVIRAVNGPSSGTWNVVLTAKNGSTYGNAQGTPICGQSRSVTHLGYVTFDGISFRGNARHGLRFGTFNNPGTVAQINGITVQNCEFTDFTGASATDGLNLSQMEFNNCTGYIVRNNYFHGNSGYGGGRTDHISATESWAGIDGLYEYSTIIQQTAGHMGKQAGHNGTTVRYCYMDLSGLSGGDIVGLFDFSGMDTASGTHADSFHHNIIVACSPMDLRNVYYSSANATTHNISCYNNTLIVKDSASSFGMHIHIDSTYTLEFYNNIIVSEATSDQAYVVTNVDATCLVDYNCYYRASGTTQWATVPNAFDNTRTYYTSQASYTTAMGANASGGANADQHSIATNPNFAGGAGPTSYRTSGTVTTAGKTNGTSGGSACEMGAWGNGAPSTIGCSLL